MNIVKLIVKILTFLEPERKKFFHHSPRVFSLFIKLAAQVCRKVLKSQMPGKHKWLTSLGVVPLGPRDPGLSDFTQPIIPED